MARRAKPLTNTQVKQAKSTDKEYSLADGNGLYLRIKPTGAKTWLFNYFRPFTKKRANLSLGPYPAISLEAARRDREEAAALLARDIDPAEYRKDKKAQHSLAASNTLKAIADKWFQIKKARVSPGYATDIYRSLELHIFPKLGKVPIHMIKARGVIEVIEPIAAKGSLETVKRLCQRLNEIMVFAVNSGLLDSNTLSGISKAFESPNKQHMPTLKPEALPDLMTALSTASIKLTTRYLVEWQLHTMTRPGEAVGTRWDEIDKKGRLWRIPANRMKKRKAHVIPLSDQAMTLLESLKPISGHREHVFPGDRNPRASINSQTANMALKRMGFGGTLVAHGLRSLASTTLNEQGFAPDVIEAALAHTDKNDVRKAYNRAEYLEQRRKMMQWWSDYIEKAADGNVSLSGTRHLVAVK